MRPESWPADLDVYIRASRARAFEWGAHDCVTFTASWVAMMRGADPIAAYRGTYATETGARRAMLSVGARNLVELARHFFGDPDPTRASLAQRGDIVFAGDALGISLGGRGAFLGTGGLAFLPARAFDLHWRI